MCSPKIEQIVRERIAREGKPQISRRNLLKFGGLTAAGLAVAGAGPARRLAAQDATPEMAMMGSGTRLIDLSHVFGVDMPTFTPGETPTREDYLTVAENGYFIQLWTLYEHAGTHMDFPAHFVEGATMVADYPVEPLLSPAVVIDISAKAEADPDATLSLEDVEAYEAANGEIAEGSVVMMYSGWDTRWNDVEAFRNADAEGVLHFPGFGIDAVDFLIGERNINGIGVDTLSLDPGNSTTFDVHYAICGSDKYGIEGVANLSSLLGMSGARVICGIPRWEGSGGGPTRVLALV